MLENYLSFDNVYEKDKRLHHAFLLQNDTYVLKNFTQLNLQAPHFVGAVKTLLERNILAKFACVGVQICVGVESCIQLEVGK